MKLLKFLSIIFLLMFLGACANTAPKGNSDYDKMLLAYNNNKAVQAKLTTEAMAACQKDANPGLCVVAVMQASGLQAGANRIPKPQPKQRSEWVSLLNTVVKTALPIYGSVRQAQISSGMWTSVVDTVAGMEAVSVSGDYITGTQNNVGGNFGDTDNSIGGDSIVGDGNLTGDGSQLTSGDGNTVGDGNLLGDSNTVGDGNIDIAGDSVLGDSNITPGNDFTDVGGDQVNGDGNRLNSNDDNSADNSVTNPPPPAP